MNYKSVLVLFTMFADVFAANDGFCGDYSVITKKSHCHAGCGNGHCHFKEADNLEKPSTNLPISTVGDVSNNSESLSATFARQPTDLPQQELVVSCADNVLILHTVSLGESKPTILTSIVDANATKLSVPAEVVISKDEVLPAQTDTKSAMLRVREVEKVEEKAPQPEEQDNLGDTEQDPRTQLHREDVIKDAEGNEINVLKPTEPISVELGKVAKSKTKKLSITEKNKTDDYETDLEEVDESEDEEESDENTDKNLNPLLKKPKKNLLKKSGNNSNA